MTTFLLIRHAHTEMSGRGLAGRLPGHVLSDVGRQQAQQLSKRLEAVRLDAVYSSPLARALETAEAIAAPLQLTIRISTDFNEINFGQWAGQSFEDLQDDPLWKRWNQFRSTSSPPLGETMVAAQARAVQELFSLGQQHQNQTVAIVSHADIIKAVLAHLLGVPLDLFQRLEIAPASISVVRILDDDVRVLHINHTACIEV